MSLKENDGDSSGRAVSFYLDPNVASTTRVGALLYMFLLELMERIEHASDYLQQTNIHRQLETIHPQVASI